ncbi:MAG: hypothetical protein AAGG51_20180 [Cyanobacteria bacterium P01_G01_bin.54]
MLSRFQLEKLKINVYGNRLRAGLPEDTFEVMFNPESYSLQYRNVFQAQQGINTSGREARYALSKPSELSLTLILDNSGVIASNGATGTLLTGSVLMNRLQGKNDVAKRVKRFLELTTHMDGAIHEPKFLKIEWGDLIFKCRLESVQIKYTLFNRAGQPTRAELETQFVGDFEASERLKKEGKNSPDLSHHRTVRAGDTLPLMTQRVYQDSVYYLQVAQVNRLNNFRQLKSGRTLHFPPIQSPGE